MAFLLHLTSPSSSSLLLHPIISFSLNSTSPGLFALAMKIIANINPKNIFRSRKKVPIRLAIRPIIVQLRHLLRLVRLHSPPQAWSRLENQRLRDAHQRFADSFDLEQEWSESSSDFYELVQAFKVIDRDGDGKITRAELSALLSRVGAEPLSEEELTVMLSEVDRDGDGCISLEEFGAISSAFGPPACDAELREAFDFFDTDHDGKITAEELLCVFSSIGDGRCTLEDCHRMISGVDKNNDGFVCFEDFTKMMGQQR